MSPACGDAMCRVDCRHDESDVSCFPSHAKHTRQPTTPPHECHTLSISRWRWPCHGGAPPVVRLREDPPMVRKLGQPVFRRPTRQHAAGAVAVVGGGPAKHPRSPLSVARACHLYREAGGCGSGRPAGWWTTWCRRRSRRRRSSGRRTRAALPSALVARVFFAIADGRPRRSRIQRL